MTAFIDGHFIHNFLLFFASAIGSLGAWWTNFFKGTDVNIEFLRKIFGENRSAVTCRWIDIIFNVPFGATVGYAFYSPHDITRAFFAGITWNIAYNSILNPNRPSTDKPSEALDN